MRISDIVAWLHVQTYAAGHRSTYAFLNVLTGETGAGKSILIDALHRTGPELTTERLIDELEKTRGLDLGIGIFAPLVKGSFVEGGFDATVSGRLGLELHPSLALPFGSFLITRLDQSGGLLRSAFGKARGAGEGQDQHHHRPVLHRRRLTQQRLDLSVGVELRRE
jgi:hypothetical protein